MSTAVKAQPKTEPKTEAKAKPVGITPNELVLIEQRGIPISGNVDTRDRLWSLGLSYKF